MEINPDQCLTRREEMEIKTLCDEKEFFNVTEEERDWLKQEYPKKGWTCCYDAVVSFSPRWYNICFRKPVMENSL